MLASCPLFHFVAAGGVYVDPWCAYKTYTNPKDKRSHSTSLLNLFCIGSTLLHWEFFFFPYKQKLKAICAQMAHPAINMWHLAFFMIARCSLVSFYIDSLPTIILDQQFAHSQHYRKYVYELLKLNLFYFGETNTI